MAKLYESKSFSALRDLKKEVSGCLKRSRKTKSLELHLKGDDIEGGKEFGEILTFLKKRGVKISHEFSIKLDFPYTISRDKTLALVEQLPKPKNGSIRVRLHLGEQVTKKRKKIKV